MRFNIKNKETTSFKKRYSMGYRLPALIFGDFSITFCKSYNLEYIYMYNFRKSFKKFYLVKKKSPKKIWLFLHKNYPLTKKSKNARMGKGKGSLIRYCFRILQNHNIMEFIGFNLREVFKLRHILKKKLNIRTKINSNFFLNKSYRCAEKNQNIFYFRSYRK